jgi:hypothetical protein
MPTPQNLKNHTRFGRLALSSGPRCPNRLFNLRHCVYDNSESDSITTLFRRVSDVRLGYTLMRIFLLRHYVLLFR